MIIWLFLKLELDRCLFALRKCLSMWLASRIGAAMALAACLAFAPWISAQSEATPGSWQEAYELGTAAIKSYDYDSATEHFRTAVALAEPFGEADPRLLKSLYQFADACWEAETCTDDEDSAALDRALKIRNGAVKEDESSAELLDKLARVASLFNRYDDALACNAEALALRRKVHGEGHATVVKTLSARAFLLSYNRKEIEARKAMEEALDLSVPASGRPSEVYVETLKASADLYVAQESPGDAHQEYDRYLTALAAIRKETDPRYIDALQSVGQRVADSDDGSYAERLFRRAVELASAAPGRDGLVHAESLGDLAGFLQAKGRRTEALSAYQEALAIHRAHHVRSVETSRLLMALADVQAALHRDDEAIATVQDSLAVLVELSGDTEARTSYPRITLAKLYARNRRYAEADEQFAIFARENRKDQSWWVGSVANDLAKIYEEQGQFSRAAPLLEESVAIDESNLAMNPEERALKLLRLAQIYQALGRHQDAQSVTLHAFSLLFSAMFGESAPAGAKEAVLIAFAIALGVYVLIVAGAAVGYAFAARRVDRGLQALYTAPSPLQGAAPSISEEQLEAALKAMLGHRAADPPPADGALQSQMVEELTLQQDDTVALTRGTDDAHAPPPPFEAQSLPVAPPPPLAQPPAAPPPPPSSLALPVTAFRFLGDGSTLFEIRVRNLLFSLLTLGVYSFWGKAIVRRYLCGQLDLEGDRLVFLGNGKELFFGWMKAVPVLGFIVLFPNVLPLFWQTPHAIWVGQLVVITIVLLLWPVAQAGAYRYRMNRMAWRGIRFSFRGSTVRYLGLHVLSYLLMLVTLGIYAPFFFTRKEKMLRSATFFGDQSVRFDGKGKDLLVPFLLAGPLTFASYWIFWPWYSALSSRYMWAHTTFAGVRFRCSVKGGPLLGLWVSNFLLLVFTLGLASSWVTSRSLRFWTTRIHLVGAPDLASIRQDVRVASATGESFADFLGFDFGI